MLQLSRLWSFVFKETKQAYQSLFPFLHWCFIPSCLYYSFIMNGFSSFQMFYISFFFIFSSSITFSTPLVVFNFFALIPAYVMHKHCYHFLVILYLCYFLSLFTHFLGFSFLSSQFLVYLMMLFPSKRLILTFLLNKYIYCFPESLHFDILIPQFFCLFCSLSY